MNIMLSRILEAIGTRHGATKELADYLGIKATVITDWKSGRCKSYPKYAPQIADYYGVSLDWLSGLTDEKQKKTPSEDEAEDETIVQIREKLNGMTKEELLKVLQMMDLMGM